MVDAVVIGAGPNGLVAANLLADAGWEVCVLEAQDTPGGAVRSAELIEPGFVNDLCSAFYPLAAASPVIAELGLESHGLRWRRAPLVLAHPTREGPSAALCPRLEDTAVGLEAAHPGDGAAWLELHALWTAARPGLLRSLFTPFPPVVGGAQLALALRRDLLRFARFLLLPVRRLGEERFGGAGARRLLAGAALHADLAPENTLSGFFGWLLCMLGQDYGFPVPEGGAGRLTDALVARLEARGGRVVCGRPVEQVLVRGGRAVGVRTAGGDEPAARAVVADVSAPALYRQLLDPCLAPARLRQDLDQFQWDHSTLKLDWNLDRPIPWLDPNARRAGTVHVIDSVDDLTISFAQLSCGLLPEKPFLLVGQQDLSDPTRHPPGAETAWAYTHVPREVRGDAAGEIDPPFDRAAAVRFAERVERFVERLAPGFRAAVRGRRLWTPADIEAHDANLVGGAISGGTAQLHQQLVFRPTPGWGRPETPIRRLYLASASAHPGGGVHGACGANAARAALWHARLRR